MTEWRAIDEFPNYEISDTGLVRNCKFNRPVAINSGRAGYFSVSLWRNNKGYVRLIHRLVAAAFVDNPGAKPHVNHIDGNKKNNSPLNLEWVTPGENNLHAARVLRRPFANAESHGMTTLTWDQVNEIRALRGTGKYDRRALAAEYGVTPTTISNIVTFKTWGGERVA